MREREDEPNRFIARQRYSSFIPSHSRESTATSTEIDETDTFEARRSRMTGFPGHLPIPEFDNMMCPPSLTTGASTISGFHSPQLALGTPQFHPESYPSQLPSSDFRCSDPLDIGVQISLEPNGGDCLEMFGTSKTGTSYSLPGHIVLTVPNTFSPAEVYGRVRLLKELKVTFEGKTEFCDDAGRYQVMRLVKSEASLLPSNGFELPARQESDAFQGFSKETAYAIPFDLKIPGWLPQTFENDTVALSYGLMATAKVEWSAVGQEAKNMTYNGDQRMDVDSSVMISSSPVAIVSAASPTYASRFFPRLAKSVATALATAITLPSYPSSQQVIRSSDWQPITIARHRVPAPSIVPSVASSDVAAEAPLRHYTLRPAENSPSPVECVVSVPETIDINGPTLRVSVRLRARNGYTVFGMGDEEDLSAQSSSSPRREIGIGSENDIRRGTSRAAESTRDDIAAPAIAPERAPSGNVQKITDQIRMVELGMEVEETERYSSSPAQLFMSAYPVPDEQPDECSPHHGSSALLSPPSRLSGMSMFGLTSSKAFKGTRTRTLLLGEDGKPRTYRFDGEGLELGAGWRKVNIIIPMPTDVSDSTASEDVNRKPATELDTPFLRIKHKLKIRIVCRSRAMPGQDTIVVLTTPLRCGTAPQPRQLDLSPSVGLDSNLLRTGSSQVPAYCQMYHENGTARDDEEPLPLYAPDSPPAYTSHFSSATFTEQVESPIALSSGSTGVALASPIIPESTIDGITPTEPFIGIPGPRTFTGFGASPIGGMLQTDDLDTTSDESIPSVPSPRGCRSVSSLSSIAESDRSVEDIQEDFSAYGSSAPSPQMGSSSALPALGDGYPTRLENRLLDMSRMSSEATLPDYMDAAQRRALVRSKHHQPSPSRLSRGTNDV